MSLIMQLFYKKNLNNLVSLIENIFDHLLLASETGLTEILN